MGAVVGKMSLRQVRAARRAGLIGLAIAVLAPVAALAQPVGAEPVFMTGAEPIDAAEYDTLPKVGQFRAFLPKQVDLSPLFPKPGYQGAQPNCVAWATTYAAHSFLVAEAASGAVPTPDPMSPAYVYNRLRKPGSACDRAIRIVDALRLLQNEGTVTLSEFPDEISRCAIPAPEALIGKAKVNRLSDWRAISRSKRADGSKVVLDDIKGALSRGEPVVFAMPVTPEFKALRGDAVYRHTMPENTNWHAMAVIGYDEGRQAFRVVNSWGTFWGDSGYVWIDYSTFGLLVGEAYAMKMQPAQAKPLPSPMPSPTPVPVPAPVDPYLAFTKKAAAVGCGKVSASRTNGRLSVSGFGGDQAELAALRAAATAIDSRVEWKVDTHRWPQCEAELTLSDALLPGDVKVAALTERGKRRSGNPVVMKSGDIFGITANATASRPWLSIVYLQADGSAVELYRGNAGDKPVTIGLGGTQETRFQVGAPFGDEMIIALSSTAPLFGPSTADYATERQFLTALRSVLAKGETGAVSAAVLRLRTN